MTGTRGVSSAGLDGGAQYRLVFIRARAPAVAVCLVIACVQMAGKSAGYSRAVRPHGKF